MLDRILITVTDFVRANGSGPARAYLNPQDARLLLASVKTDGYEPEVDVDVTMWIGFDALGVTDWFSDPSVACGAIGLESKTVREIRGI